MGDEFSAKDFRTWGGTLIAAVALAERGLPESATAQRRTIAAVMRKVGEQLGNTPAVARASYVSPAVIEQYLDGRTIEDFRPRHLRVVRGRDSGSRSGGAGAAVAAPIVANSLARERRREFHLV